MVEVLQAQGEKMVNTNTTHTHKNTQVTREFIIISFQIYMGGGGNPFGTRTTKYE
jgi:hypothetical protein